MRGVSIESLPGTRGIANFYDHPQLAKSDTVDRQNLEHGMYETLSKKSGRRKLLNHL